MPGGGRRRHGRAPRDAALVRRRARDADLAGACERGASRPRRRARRGARRTRVHGRAARAVLVDRRGNGRPRLQCAGRRGRGRGAALLQRSRRSRALLVHHAGDCQPRAGHDRDRQQRPIARGEPLGERLDRDPVAYASRRAGGARGPLARARATRRAGRDRAPALLGECSARRGRGARVRGPRRGGRGSARGSPRGLALRGQRIAAARPISSARARGAPT